MLLPDTRLINAPVLSLQTGAPLGQITEAIIDPRQLVVIAFYCMGARIHGRAVVHTEDIREVSPMGLIVDDADVLMEPDESLVRLQQIINFRFQLIGKPVRDTLAHKLGKVQGYSVDIDSFYVIKLNIRQPMLKDIFGGTLLIDRTQVVEVNDHYIVTQPNVAKQKQQGTRQLSPLLDNPFRQRKTTPQPGGARMDAD